MEGEVTDQQVLDAPGGAGDYYDKWVTGRSLYLGRIRNDCISGIVRGDYLSISYR